MSTITHLTLTTADITSVILQLLLTLINKPRLILLQVMNPLIEVSHMHLPSPIFITFFLTTLTNEHPPAPRFFCWPQVHCLITIVIHMKTQFAALLPRGAVATFCWRHICKPLVAYTVSLASTECSFPWWTYSVGLVKPTTRSHFWRPLAKLQWLAVYMKLWG